VLGHLAVLAVPLAAGVVVFGWRSIVVLTLVGAGAGLGALCWRRLGRRGAQVGWLATAWAGLLVALLMPADFGSQAGLATALGAGLLVPGAIWLCGPPTRGRVSAAAAVVVLVTVAEFGELRQRAALQPSTVVVGDVMNVGVGTTVGPRAEPWVQRSAPPGFDALPQELPAAALAGLTPATTEAALRDRMPPLEDLVGLGRPGPIGASSAVAVVLAGLLLVRLGAADWRVPLGAGVGAYLGLLALPLGGAWPWPHLLGWEAALTLVHYELLGGSILFTGLILAAQPGVRPVAPRPRLAFGLLLGVAMAAGQRFASPDVGPLIALLLVGGVATNVLERLLPPRPLMRA
jgi:hypothetical protein